MYSTESIYWFQFLINIGYKLKCLPFYIDTDNERSARLKCGTNKIDMIIRKLVACLIFVSQSALISLGIYYELYYNTSPSQSAQFFFIASFMTTGMSFLVITIMASEKIFGIIDTFFVFGEKMHHIHKTGPDYKDGLEKFIKAFVYVAFASAAFVSPPAYIRVAKEKHYGVFLNVHPLAPLAFCITFSFWALVDWIFVFVFVGFLLIYFTGTMQSLDIMKRTHFGNPSNLKATMVIYRAHQIYNNLIMSGFQNVVLLCITCGSLVMITMTYAVIGFHSQMLLGVFAATITSCTCALLMKLLLVYATNLTKSSLEYPASYLRNNLVTSKVNRLRLNSCRGLYVSIGNIAKVKDITFPTLMSDVVISNTINLLLM